VKLPLPRKVLAKMREILKGSGRGRNFFMGMVELELSPSCLEVN
jgi:hypothetical protein